MLRRSPLNRKTPLRPKRKEPGGEREPRPMASEKTGWPAPELAQDDDRKLFGWFASRLDARQRVREAVGQIEPASRRGSYSGGVSGEAVGKVERVPGGKAEHEHKEKLASLGCMACLRIHGPHAPGPVELHHLRGGGWGRGSYLTLIPLCVEHHRGATGVHGLGTKAFGTFHGFTQADLLADALRALDGMKERG